MKYVLDIGITCTYDRDKIKKCFEPGCWDPEINLERLKDCGYGIIPSDTKEFLCYCIKYESGVVNVSLPELKEMTHILEKDI